MILKKKIKKRDFIRNGAKVTATAIGFPYIISCKPGVDEEMSDLDWLNWSSWQVDPFPKRTESVKQLGFLANAKGIMNDSKLLALAERAAALPDAYLQYLEKSSNQGFYVEVNRFGQGWAGLCMLGDPPGFVKIELSSVRSGYVLNHECGHAVMNASFKGLGGAQNDRGMLSKVYSQAKGSSEGSAAWDYAMKNYREYWACGVSSYYASKACRDDLQKNYQIAWQYFSNACPPPPTDAAVGQAGNPNFKSNFNQQDLDDAKKRSDNYQNQPYDPNSTRPQSGQNFPPQNSNPGFGSSDLGGLAQSLSNTFQQFMAFQMQQEYQKLQYLQQNMYKLTAQSKPQMDNIHNGYEVHPGMELYVEIVPGVRDLTELRNYNVFLKDKKSSRHVELPSNFTLDVPYLIGGHAWTEVITPSHQKIAELVNNRFDKDESGVEMVKLDLVVTDKNKNVVDTREIEYVKEHVDSARDMRAMVRPNSFASLHKSKIKE